MDLAEPEPAAEIDAAGPALEGGVIGLDGPRPVARPLLIEPLFQTASGSSALRASGRGGGSGRAGVAGERAHATEPVVPARQDQEQPGQEAREQAGAWTYDPPARERCARGLSVAGDARVGPFDGVGRGVPGRIGRWNSASVVDPENLHPAATTEDPCAPLRRCRSMESFPAKAGTTIRGLGPRAAEETWRRRSERERPGPIPRSIEIITHRSQEVGFRRSEGWYQLPGM